MIYRTICVISVWNETWAVLLLHPEDKGTINPLNIIHHSFGDSLWQKWVPGIFSGGKSRRCVGLTTLLTSCADCIEIWEPEAWTSFNCQGLSRPVQGLLYLTHSETQYHIPGDSNFLQPNCEDIKCQHYYWWSLCSKLTIEWTTLNRNLLYQRKLFL